MKNLLKMRIISKKIFFIQVKKKSQKTPKQEIAKAIKIKTEYENDRRENPDT